MVVQHSLTKIMSFIENERLTPMMKWSERSKFELGQPNKKNQYFQKLVRNIRKLLKLISGDDLGNMIQGLTIFIYL